MLQVWHGGASRVRVDEKKGDAYICRNLMSPDEGLRKEREFLHPGKSDFPISYFKWCFSDLG